MKKNSGIAYILIIVIVALAAVVFLVPHVYNATTERSMTKIIHYPGVGLCLSQQCPKAPPPRSENLAEFEKGQFEKDIVEEVRTVGVEAKKSVVVTRVSDPPGIGTGFGAGTGFFIRENLILTAGHNVCGPRPVTVHTYDGKKLAGKLVNCSLEPDPDVGLLRVEGYKGTPLSLGSTKDLKRGQPLILVGTPGGIGPWSIVLGKFLNIEPGAETFATNIPIRGGASGSPVLDFEGKVVGLLTGGGLREPYQYFPDFGQPPKDDTVYQEQFRSETIGSPTSIEVVLKKVEEWTGQSFR